MQFLKKYMILLIMKRIYFLQEKQIVDKLIMFSLFSIFDYNLVRIICITIYLNFKEYLQSMHKQNTYNLIIKHL